MSHNLIVKPAKAALTAVGWLLKLVVTIVSGCVSALFVAFKHDASAVKEDPFHTEFQSAAIIDEEDKLIRANGPFVN